MASVVGRNYYGVFPLRGKLLNVREATHKQITENAEIQNISDYYGSTKPNQFSKMEHEVITIFPTYHIIAYVTIGLSIRFG